MTRKCVRRKNTVPPASERKFYDLLLLDIEMPAVTGMELAKVIKEKMPSARIVFVTSHVWETDTMSGINWCTVPTTLIEVGYMTRGTILSQVPWKKVSAVQPEEWNNRLEEIKIRSWKPEYRPPEGVVILDGTEWEVHFTAGQRTRHIYGDNAYPHRWKSLMELLEAVCPEGHYPPACRW